MSTTLPELFDGTAPIEVSGQRGYWGASPELATLAKDLQQALATRDSTEHIIEDIADELFCERQPTPDEMDYDEIPHRIELIDPQQWLWEREAER